jgi:DUF917 family protein
MLLDRAALADLARGAAILGSGGGGDPYHARLMCELELERGIAIELIDVEALPDDALVAPCGWIGAPTVSAEKLPNGCESILGLRKLEEIRGAAVDAVMPIEVGGANCFAPLIAAAQLGLPVVDCDGMGRAFPESQMVIFNIRGVRACPSILTDASGALALIDSDDNLVQERLARAIAVAMGGIAHMVEYPLTGRQAKEHGIRGSLSAAQSVGAAIRTARRTGGDPFAALFAALRDSGLYPHAGVMFDGKIVDLERETKGGFSIGRVLIEEFKGKGIMELEFQNENLIARRDGRLCASVPDIITVMDSETADSITTERLKFGQRVRVIGAAAPAVLRDRMSLPVVGPAAFGLRDGYRPIEELNGWAPG